MPVELYRIHRPKTFKSVIGQDDACKMLQSKLKKGKLPHCLLFTGPSGCGKTTLARILQVKLNCDDGDYQELNASDKRGIDDIREIQKRIWTNPIGGDHKIFCIDECHKLTKDAQNAFLKTLEDIPDHVYFFLLTTDPADLINTIHTRSTEVKVKGLGLKEMRNLITTVAEKEDISLTDEVIEQIIDSSNGSARKALVFLNSISDIEDEGEQLQLIQSQDSRRQAIELARELMQTRRPGENWGKIAKILKGLSKEEPESIRHMVLSYCNTILLSGGKVSNRAFLIMTTFSDSFFYTKHPGLTMACYAVCMNR